MEIHLLIKNMCKVLQLLDVHHLKPECFRRAKHNQDQSNEVLLHLLHKSLCFIEKSSTNSCNVDFQECMIESRLKALGYSGNIAKNDSREILIAFGWLMACYTLIDCLIFEMLSTSPLFCNEALILMKKKSLSNEAGNSSDDDNYKTEEECINDLMCLSQKLHSDLKLWHIAEEQKMSLLFKIQKFVENDTELRKLIITRYPELQLQLNSECDKIQQYIEAYFKWKKNEYVFWKWMESVLQLKCMEKEFSKKVPDFIEVPEFAQKNLENLKSEFQNFNQQSCERSSVYLNELEEIVSSFKDTLIANEESMSDLLMGNKFKHRCSGKHNVHTFSVENGNF